MFEQKNSKKMLVVFFLFLFYFLWVFIGWGAARTIDERALISLFLIVPLITLYGLFRNRKWVPKVYLLGCCISFAFGHWLTALYVGLENIDFGLLLYAIIRDVIIIAFFSACFFSLEELKNEGKKEPNKLVKKLK